MARGYIGVDLDGTLAVYEEWRGPAHIGPPIPIMVERVKRWLAAGNEVRIFTARASHPEESKVAIPAIKAWCLKHIGVELEVTCVKHYSMIEYWDDRAVAVESNSGEVLGGASRIGRR